jgi:hypothetical protein
MATRSCTRAFGQQGGARHLGKNFLDREPRTSAVTARFTGKSIFYGNLSDCQVKSGTREALASSVWSKPKVVYTVRQKQGSISNTLLIVTLQCRALLERGQHLQATGRVPTGGCRGLIF